MSDRYEDAHAKTMREYHKAAKAVHPDAELSWGAIMGTALFAILFALALFGPELRGPEIREARDKAELSCRLSGGTYEYFGTQGYHCIGGQK